MTQVSTVTESLEQIGQTTLARHIASADNDAASSLGDQLAAFDLDALASYIDRYGAGYAPPEPPSELRPAPFYAKDGGWDKAAYHAQGEKLIKDGKLACFVVAGGQGSRLGYDGPKGCYPATCVNEKPLFQVFAETILASQRRYGVTIPWLIMTSPLNHDATVSFFESHNHFGLDKNAVLFFQQGVMPSFDLASGDLLLSDKRTLATNPDGHGGAYHAMERSGALDELEKRGVEHVSYFQVDNPHTRIIDPVLLGLHVNAPDSSGQLSSKMVAKSSWDERVGVFCADGDTTLIVEYSDLPESLAKQTNDDGSLAFGAGSVAIHVMSVAFIRDVLKDQDAALPFHRAVKKVPHYDPQSGATEAPSEPNAVKLERFVFDALRIAEKPLILETERLEEFAPIKNASGSDSAESSKALQSERAATWLGSHGVSIPRNPDGSVNATIEISPLAATCAEELGDADLPTSIEPGSSVVIG